MEIVEEPLGRRRDERAFADVLRQLPVRGLERVGVVTQSRIDATRVALFGVDGEVGRQGKRPLLKPL